MPSGGLCPVLFRTPTPPAPTPPNVTPNGSPPAKGRGSTGIKFFYYSSEIFPTGNSNGRFRPGLQKGSPAIPPNFSTDTRFYGLPLGQALSSPVWFSTIFCSVQPLHAGGCPLAPAPLGLGDLQPPVSVTSPPAWAPAPDCPWGPLSRFDVLDQQSCFWKCESELPRTQSKDTHGMYSFHKLIETWGLQKIQSVHGRAQGDVRGRTAQ